MKINIPPFEKARVIIVGDVMLDRYWHGDSARISPEAPVPVVHVRQFEDRAGGAANVACNVCALGAKAILFGLIGNDKEGQLLQKILDQTKVESHLIKVSDAPTISKLRIIGRNQQLIRLDLEEHFADANAEILLADFAKSLASADIVILSDYGKGTLKEVQKFISLARAANIPVLVDPKSKHFGIYAGATVITPNYGEFVAVVGNCSSNSDIESKGLALLHKYNFHAVLVTRGAQGMSLICEDKKVEHLPTHASEVYDVTGAGDTVIATLGTSLAVGEDLFSAMVLANAAAGVAVKKIGAAAISSSELRRAMAHQQDPWVAILDDEEHLMQQVKDARSHGEKIIMTNGCFDILHAGHVTYLERAKDLGGRLIIAVNSDESVKKLKGASRPINNLQQRMLLLAALRAVDWVVAFSEDTPERLIKLVSPDVLVKGGDYKVDEIAGAKHVLSYGGKVIIIPFEEGFSTSTMLARIREEGI
ncbi:MAG: bifunctional D-glycero-beta-D-manno-heptose-7-phosphate kinase/D-glycero-beta-D-manno-heptose 1-phosphate adenylyltransferase HldE [Gammaproteobacteria bacterium]|nr:bifunctional D-glycero-beta-D-manno-heptose-7-phosphate kinase/D-glycero-beta-D-manno-heptose 1-phosphate adenylyltransferase HldE [Gammaproteobacteria bacterium]